MSAVTKTRADAREEALTGSGRPSRPPWARCDGSAAATPTAPAS